MATVQTLHHSLLLQSPIPERKIMENPVRQILANPVPTMKRVLLGLGIFHVLAPTPAWAYLDPITGSIVLQILAAGLIAAAATFRRSRDAVATFLRKFTRDR